MEHKERKITDEKSRGHPDLNRGPLDLQSNALPLSYTPIYCYNVSNCHYITRARPEIGDIQSNFLRGCRKSGISMQS